jgi:hypothetical protein
VVAWGLRHPDGWVATVSLEPSPSRAMTMWPSAEAAEEALDAFMDIPRPIDTGEIDRN